MTPSDATRYERLLRYELACQDAGERLLPFCRFRCQPLAS